MTRIAFCFLLTTAFCIVSAAQAKEGADGIALLNAGRYQEASNSLNSAVKTKTGKVNAELWNALGLAESMLDEHKKAIKSFKKATELSSTEATYWTNLGYAKLRLRDLNGAQSATDRAIKLAPNNAFAYYVRGLADLWEGDLDDAQKNYLEIRSRDNKFTNGYILGSWVKLARLNRLVSKKGESGSIRDHLDVLKEAVEILQAGVENCVGCTGKEMLFTEYEGLTYFYDHFSKEPKTPGTPIQPEPNVTPVKILSKPRASYTDAARTANISGTIRIVVLLKPDGTVGHTFVLQRLGYGLDENALRAARAIKFEPKVRSGKPVPAVITIEYSFSIY